MSRVEPFWRMPRWLARAVDRGDLSFVDLGLLCYLGASGLEYHGVSATLGSLAAVADRTPKTVTRSLRRLREARLIEYDLRERQRRPFLITAGPALDSGVSALYFKPSAAPTAALSSVEGSAVTAPVSQSAITEPESRSGVEADSERSRVAVAKNEKENRKPLAPTERLVRDTSTGVSHRGGVQGGGVVPHQGAVSPEAPPASVDRRSVTEHLLAAELLATFPGATEVVLDDEGWTTVAQGPYGTLAIRDLPPDRGNADDHAVEEPARD